MWRASLVATRPIAPHEEILVPYSDDYVYPVFSAPPRSLSPETPPTPSEVVDLVSSDSSATEGVIDLCSTLSAESTTASSESDAPRPAPPPEPPPSQS